MDYSLITSILQAAERLNPSNNPVLQIVIQPNGYMYVWITKDGRFYESVSINMRRNVIYLS